MELLGIGIAAAGYIGTLIYAIATIKGQVTSQADQRKNDREAEDKRRKAADEAEEKRREAADEAADARHQELMKGQQHLQESATKLWGVMDEVRTKMATTATELASFQKLEDERHLKTDRAIAGIISDGKLNADELRGDIKAVGRSLQEFKDRGWRTPAAS